VATRVVIFHHIPCEIVFIVPKNQFSQCGGSRSWIKRPGFDIAKAGRFRAQFFVVAAREKMGPWLRARNVAISGKT